MAPHSDLPDLPSRLVKTVGERRSWTMDDHFPQRAAWTSGSVAFSWCSMKRRPLERFVRLNVGVLAGALGSAAVGAVFGFAFWVTGIGFAYDRLDWPIGGAIFPTFRTSHHNCPANVCGI
jgi:hypothetical protein